MKNLFIVIVLCATLQTLPAQVFLGMADYRIKYEMSYMEDTAKNVVKTDLIYLDVGKDASKCYSFNRHYRDSLQSSMFDQGKQMGEILSSLAGLRNGVGYIMAKQYRTQTLLVSDMILATRYTYSEQIPQVDWMITQDTCTILSYPCRKATAQFRGRDWVAWFTTEIPIQDGPMQFGGLPGLILHLEDTQKQYIFTCIGMEQLIFQVAMEFQNSLRNGRPYPKISREQFLRQARAAHADPSEQMRTLGITIRQRDGSEMVMPTHPYNPIELR
ncbi:MAG: GLPGLI family protein [Bacteroidales bacterium]|nr:GLPGLI family protein [Bacteroidales bacterium]